MKITKTLRSKILLATFIASLVPGVIHAEKKETPAQRDTRMEWWRDARFGMFIHWGPDAIPSLHWKGNIWKPSDGYIPTAHESICNIPAGDWDKEVIQKFNPVDYDADKWVQLAKAAGMKYVVLTTKHHNGFCLWPGLKGYDIRSTPFTRDPVGELVAACRKHDMRIGFYYSQLDWHDPDAIGDNKSRGYPDGWIDKPDVFLPRMRAQLRDLLTRYGKIDVLWFDGDWIKDWTPKIGRELEAELRSIQPDIIINNRVGKRAPSDGDFKTPEQEIPANGLPGVDWETCMTMNGTWFYVKQDKQWKSTQTLLHNLIDITSKGGNYLLNVGPDARGNIPTPSIERLKVMGQWMDINAESIRGTLASPFPKQLSWGRCTRRTLPDGNTRLYLHVFKRPIDGELRLPRISNKITKVHPLVSPTSSLKHMLKDNGLFIQLSKDKPTGNYPVVVVLDLEGETKSISAIVTPDANR